MMQLIRQREYYTSAALMWMPDDGWALDYSADWMMNSLNSTLATDLRPHRHGILQSLSVRYAKGRWVALARMLAHGFRISFTLLIGVLFTFPSRYSFTIGR